MIEWTVTDDFLPSHAQQNFAISLFEQPTRKVCYSTDDPISKIRQITLNQYSNRQPEVIIAAISAEAAFEIRLCSLTFPVGVNLISDSENNSITINGIENDGVIESLITMMEIYSGDVSNQLDESNLRLGLGIAIRMAVSDYLISITYAFQLNGDVELDEHDEYDEYDGLAFSPKLGS